MAWYSEALSQVTSHPALPPAEHFLHTKQYGRFNSIENYMVAQTVKNLPAMGDQVRSLGWEDLLEKGMATHSSILAWKIPWTKKLGELQSLGSQRVRHN